MTDIFISYRRTDSFQVERLQEKLASRFPAASIFLDRNDIRPGERFPERIRAEAQAAPLMLIVLGRDWASVQDPTTLKRRIEVEDDWVRQEVDIGLTGGRTAIPVLLEGAVMPTAAQLPQSLQSLITREAVTVTFEHFNEGANRLLKAVEAHLGEARARNFGHHPRWENVFRTVTVRLSTFDIAHRPSERDVGCAKMIEGLYKKAVEDR